MSAGWPALVALTIAGLTASPSVPAPDPPPADNAELARMNQEDQADRQGTIHDVDWTVVKPRDDARLKRTKELYAAGALRTGRDWLRAAMILQHGNDADDFLLAHEMCVVALAQGVTEARGLAAASEDRFLRKIGRSQRFGSQFEPEGEPGKWRFRLAPMDTGVTDELRAAMGVPPLAEIKASESQFDFDKKK
jgi:hypothetical protein